MKEAIIQYNNDPDTDGNHMVISWKELVRCKDCKHHGTMDCPMCEEADCPFTTADNWYCADGEKEVK